jgi:hypothetical protein
MRPGQETSRFPQVACPDGRSDPGARIGTQRVTDHVVATRRESKRRAQRFQKPNVPPAARSESETVAHDNPLRSQLVAHKITHEPLRRPRREFGVERPHVDALNPDCMNQGRPAIHRR